MPAMMKKSIGLGLALGLAASSPAAPARADDGGAVAAGVIGGLALGALAGSAMARPAPPPPPPPVYYAPVYAPPPTCWYEPQQVWTGYAYIIQRVRVCN